LELTVVFGPLALSLMRLTVLKDNIGFGSIGIRVSVQVLMGTSPAVAG